MRIITFYSYKGGSCRTSTAMNTIPHLAETLQATKENPILVMDLDIDSVGMTYLLNQNYDDRSTDDITSFLKRDGLVPCREVKQFSECEFLSKLRPVGNLFGLDDNCAVYFIGAYSDAKFDNSRDGARAADRIRKIRDICELNHFKAIVIDSAGGNQGIARYATQESDEIICCMRPTTQFRTGTMEYVKRFIYNAGGGYTDFIILPTAVPRNDIKIDNVPQIQKTIDEINDEIDDVKAKLAEHNISARINRDFVKQGCFGIPEVDRFRWQENNLYRLRKQGVNLLPDEELALDRYKKLSETIKDLMS